MFKSVIISAITSVTFMLLTSCGGNRSQAKDLAEELLAERVIEVDGFHFYKEVSDSYRHDNAFKYVQLRNLKLVSREEEELSEADKLNGYEHIEVFTWLSTTDRSIYKKTKNISGDYSEWSSWRDSAAKTDSIVIKARKKNGEWEVWWEDFPYKMLDDYALPTELEISHILEEG